MSTSALSKAIDILGGQAATARLLSKSRPERKPLKQAHIWGWLNSPNPDLMPPAEYCPDIERETAKKDARVSCEELRPDVDWAVVRSGEAA